MQSNCKITVNLVTLDISEQSIHSKHEVIGEYDLNYRLIYFQHYDCLYSRGIILADDSQFNFEWVKERVVQARKLLTDRYNKVIFCATDEDCPAELVKMASYY